MIQGKKRISKIIGLCLLAIIIGGFLVPQHLSMPVVGATHKSYNHNSFWHYPWGKSGTHKGVDIFAKEGTNVVAATGGMVVQAKEIEMGGNVVLVLGPKWRLHYYAHLKEIKTKTFTWVNKGEIIGTVGTTGNAVGKEPHLHYSIYTAIPYPWRIDSGPQGWKKMFFLDPVTYLKELK